MFDVVHKAAYCILAPADTIRRVFRWFSSKNNSHQDIPSEDFVASVPTSVLSDNDPTLLERKRTFHNSLNTDARTCQDVITELGYENLDLTLSLLSLFLLSWIMHNLLISWKRS